jgi:hypothetical protein
VWAVLLQEGAPVRNAKILGEAVILALNPT